MLANKIQQILIFKPRMGQHWVKIKNQMSLKIVFAIANK